MTSRNRLVLFLVVAVAASCYGQTNVTEAAVTSVEQTTITSTETPTTTTTSPRQTVLPTADPEEDSPRGSWNLTENNRTCILSQMGIRLSFDYTDKDNKNVSVNYDVPAQANETTLSGSCGSGDEASENMQIAFFENDTWSLSLTFKYEATKKEWSVSDIGLEFVFSEARFPNVTSSTKYTVTLTNQTLFQTPNGSSYQCVSKESLNDFNKPDDAPSVTITTTELRVEAFRIVRDGTFSISVPCPADTEVSNIVPIAVGAALAALIVIVLIAYLIGRKKNRQGYESV